MKNRTTKLFLIASLFASASIGSQAWADGPKAAAKPEAPKAVAKAAPDAKSAIEAKSATNPLFDQLPVGEIKTPTKLAVPNAIGRNESVEGVYVEVPEYLLKNPSGGTRYAQVFASKEDATARNSGQPPPESASCFMSASPSFNGETDVRWNGAIGPNVAVSPYPKSYSYGAAGASPKDMINVQAVRADRITQSGADKITLESRVVFIDAQTLGARLVSTDKVDFALIKELPGRVKVYGARSKDQVTFLVRRQKHPQERFAMGGMFVQQGMSNSMSASDDCHVTFTMPAKAATSATAVLQLEAVLDIKDPTSDDDSQGGATGTGAEFRPAAAPGTREGHIRTLEIGFSSTFMSQDKAPVLSLSSGWLGRERTQQM